MSSAPRAVSLPTLAGHFQIARVDHWVKSVFVLPGIVVPLALDRAVRTPALLGHALLGIFATCLVTSANYVINEVMDAPFDRWHPLKSGRPVPSGKVSVPLAIVEWIGLAALGIGLGLYISIPFAATLLALWIMGCLYNLPPIRTKDLPYVDVLSEAVNNPLRMLAGWYITGSMLVPSASLLASYWMIGCYFMALKRYAELRDLGDSRAASAYRRSFAFYTDERLLTSVVFYASSAMLFFGAFMTRYRMELLLAVPLIALVLACYLRLAFKPDSAVQRPEGLYREPALMAAVISCSIAMSVLLFVDVPAIYSIFAPMLPMTK